MAGPRGSRKALGISSSKASSSLFSHSGKSPNVILSTSSTSKMQRRKSTNNNQPQRRSNKDLRCYKCNKIGHAAKDCSLPIVCKWCQRIGHHDTDCREKIQYLQQQQENQELYCIRCKTVGHRVQDCTMKREDELHAPQKKQYPRENKEPPDGVNWPAEELRVIKRIAVLAELIADSKLQKARHETFRDLAEPVNRSITFRSRLTGNETKMSLTPDNSKQQKLKFNTGSCVPVSSNVGRTSHTVGLRCISFQRKNPKESLTQLRWHFSHP